MWEFLNDYVLPSFGILISIISVPLAGLAGAVLLRLFAKYGVQLEANDREAFQTSITNAAKLAVSKMGGPAATNTISDEALKEAVKQVEKAVPDAVARFKVSSDDIAERIKPQAEIIAQSVTTVLDVALAANPLINVVRKIIK